MTASLRRDPKTGRPPRIQAAISRDSLWLPALLVLFTAQWAGVVFSDQTFYFRDLFFFFSPLLIETGRQLMAGVFPAWNPHLAGGAPLAADPNVGLFFPDTLLLPLFGAGPHAVKALLLFRLFALALASYAALRAVRLSPPSAFLGAALVSLSGPVSSSLSSFPPILAGGVLLLPLAVCGFRLADPGRGATLVAPVLVALLAFAGSPEMAVQGALLFLVCGIRAPLRRTLPRLFIALAAGIALAAPQILPAVRLFPRTPRGQFWELARAPGFLSFPPPRLVEFLWPGFFGDPTVEGAHAFWGRGFSDGFTPYLLSVSVGLLPLVLLPIAWRHPFGRRLGVGATLFLLLSFGKFWPFGQRAFELPMLRMFRFPEKWMIGAVLALAGLAAVGLEELNRDGDRRFAAAWIAGAIALLSVALTAWTVLSPESLIRALRTTGLVESRFPVPFHSFVVRRLLREGLSALAVSLALAVLFRRAGRALAPGSSLPLFLILIAVGERLPRATGATPTTSIRLFTVASDGVRRAREGAGEGRFFYDREASTLLDPLRPFTGTIFGLSYAGNTDIDHFSDVRSRAFAETLQRLDFFDPRKLALLRLSNVRVVSTNDPLARSRPGLRWLQPLPDGRALYIVEDSYPGRVFFHAVAARDVRQALRYMLARGLPMESVAVVEGTASFRRSPGAKSVLEVSFPRPDSFSALVRSESEAILQLAVTFDPNWRIRVDGKRVEPLAVDSVFLGVRLPSGRHDVRGEFRDRMFLVGSVVSLSVVAGLGLFGFKSMGRRLLARTEHHDS